MWLTCLLNVCVMSVLPFEQLLACFLMSITIHNSKNNVNTFNLIHFILIKKRLASKSFKITLSQTNDRRHLRDLAQYNHFHLSHHPVNQYKYPRLDVRLARLSPLLALKLT